MKKLINIFAVMFAVVVLLTLTVKTVGATFQLPNVTICHVPSNPDQTLQVNLNALGGHLGHGDYLGSCSSPTPSPSPSPSPSPEPEEEYCDDESALNYKEEGECQYPEEEATPTAVPLTQGNEGCSQDCQPSYHPPVCNGVPAEPFTLNSVTIIDSSNYEFFWTNKGDADHYDLIFGYTPETMVYGAVNLPANAMSYTVSDFVPNSHIWMQVFAYRNNCSTVSNVLDP